MYLSCSLPVIVAVDIEVSNSGMPVNAPTKLFKLFEEDNVFNEDDEDEDDLFVDDVLVVVAVVALKVEDKGDNEEDGVTSNPVIPTPTSSDTPTAWSGEEEGEGVGKGMIQGLIFILTKRSIWPIAAATKKNNK